MIDPNLPLFHIVLVEPEIPHNTGNIGRTCVAMNCHLHLVGPLAFDISEKQVRRAGLDYWRHLKLTQYENFANWQQAPKDPSRCFYFTTKTKQTIYGVQFQQGDWLVFGPETRGLSAQILQDQQSQLVTLPMLGETRSLNLSNAVAVGLYEGYRQLISPF